MFAINGGVTFSFTHGSFRGGMWSWQQFPSSIPVGIVEETSFWGAWWPKADCFLWWARKWLSLPRGARNSDWGCGLYIKNVAIERLLNYTGFPAWRLLDSSVGTTSLWLSCNKLSLSLSSFSLQADFGFWWEWCGWKGTVQHPFCLTWRFKVGLGFLEITSAKRCPQVWPWFGRSLFSNLLNLIKRCSDQHAEIFMNETNMQVFSQIESPQVDIKSLKYRKESIWSIIRC